MIEILKNAVHTAYIDLTNESADQTPTATLTRPNGTVVSLQVTEDTPPTGVSERWGVNLGFAATQSEGLLSVKWTLSIDGETVETEKYYTVVTPYLDIPDVMTLLETDDEAAAIEVERAVRHIIHAHTGQEFGHIQDASFTVEGHGEAALRLPRRLIKLTGLSTLTATLNPNSAIITSDGWYLKKGWSEEVSPLVTDSTYWNGWEPTQDAAPGEPGYEKPGHGYIIHAPGVRATPTSWRSDYPFIVRGEWGYKFVPAAVQEAARLLINDYACSEAAYRDRYLESIKAADWRLQFSTRAWESTGNVRADQLLDEYVLMDWAVI